MTPLEPLEFPPPRPRLRFWHILLGGMACLLLMLVAVGVWHLLRVRRQAHLVAQIDAAGGSVDYYDEYMRLPDGDFDYESLTSRSIFPRAFRQEYPNFCSQVFGVETFDQLNSDQTEQFLRAAKG